MAIQFSGRQSKDHYFIESIAHSTHKQQFGSCVSGVENKEKEGKAMMKKKKISSTVVNAVCLILILCLVMICDGEKESPEYTVLHNESDFEIRLYRDSVWITALAQDISFEKATWNGFHRLFQYTEGANLNFSRIPLTVPVLTSLVPRVGPLRSQAYYVSLYLPDKFQETPPLPLPELNIRPYEFSSHCIAVRKFSGKARDSRIVKEAQKLANSLSRSPWADSGSSSSRTERGYSIAQYQTPFQILSRKNEVWVEVNAPDLGCRSKLVGAASY